MRSNERMRGALDSFAKYVPTPVVRELLRQGEAARLGGRVRPITVLFTDIRGFTGVSEGMTPAALTALLQNHIVNENESAEMVMGMAGQAFTSAAGNPLEVTVDGDTVMVGEATVERYDLTASNGVVHVIDAVLVPSG